MQAGDWVTIEGKRLSNDRRSNVPYIRIRRIARVTPTGWIMVSGCSYPFKSHSLNGWRDKDWDRLRPSTLEEIAQGEALERELAAQAQARRDDANAIRLKLSGLDWNAIDDATVERIVAMVQDQRNRIQPVQLKFGKGKR